MRQHLAFLRRYRDVLRLKLNAAEDLLVNGQREPTDRGVCRHLLAKVDRSAIDGALAREPLRSDLAGRARMLAGALRLTGDTGVLLDYLEALAKLPGREEAAAAFGEAVARIDFEALSGTRLARLLGVLLETFVGHERVQVLFSLSAAPGFRRAFDAAVELLRGPVADAFAPLHALQAYVATPAEARMATAAAVVGLAQVVRAPDSVVRGYDEGLREAMLELALGPGVDAEVVDRAVGVLLPSLANGGRRYARFALRRTAALLRTHADDRARGVLRDLLRAQPGHRTAERWQRALEARHLGRVALVGEAASGRMMPGFWLDAQSMVWLRTVPEVERERIAAEADVQRGLLVPGVATVVEEGVALGSAYVAVAGRGRPLDGTSLAVRETLLLVSGVARLLMAVARAGVGLPDAAPARFVYEPVAGPLLLDLDGARAVGVESAVASHAGVAREFARAVGLGEVIRRHGAVIDLDAGLLDDAVPPAELVTRLERAAAFVAPG